MREAICDRFFSVSSKTEIAHTLWATWPLALHPREMVSDSQHENPL